MYCMAQTCKHGWIVAIKRTLKFTFLYSLKIPFKINSLDHKLLNLKLKTEV